MCRESGGNLFEVVSIHPDNPLNGLTGLEFDSENITKNGLLETLNALKTFTRKSTKQDVKDYDNGAGWAMLKIPSRKKILVIKDEDAEKLLSSKTISIVTGKDPLEYVLLDENLKDSEFKQNDFKKRDPSEGGVVILSEGANMVYEMQKTESIAFLMRGVDVMMTNFRGFGSSIGDPNEEGTYEDIRTVYQYIKDQKHIPDEKILVKGLCLGGGIVTRLIKDHPDLNFCLDQTFANLQSMILKQIGLSYHVSSNLSIRKRMTNRLLKAFEFFMKPVLKITFPDYRVQGRLPKIQGKVLIITSSRDQEVPKDTLYEIIKEMVKKRKESHVMAGVIPGQHATCWAAVRENCDEKNQTFNYSGRVLMDEFLKRLDLLHPIF